MWSGSRPDDVVYDGEQRPFWSPQRLVYTTSAVLGLGSTHQLVRHLPLPDAIRDYAKLLGIMGMVAAALTHLVLQLLKGRLASRLRLVATALVAVAMWAFAVLPTAGLTLSSLGRVHYGYWLLIGYVLSPVMVGLASERWGE